MNYTLRGSIARTQPYQLDPTLTLEGAGAEAKATGEAIARVQAEVTSHGNNTSNPHNVTKSQLGLENVDNTSDMDKPVSHAQEYAIADAKRTGEFAQNTADEAMAACVANHTLTTEVKTIAEEAKTTADEAMSAVENAQATADGKVSIFTARLTLDANNWRDNKQAAYVTGVTGDQNQPIIITPNTESVEDYVFFGIQPLEQEENLIGFFCDKIPDTDIYVTVLGFNQNGTVATNSE